MKGQPKAGAAVVKLALLVLSVLLWAGTCMASAATVANRPLLFSFNGADTTAGAIARIGGIAVDQSTGNVYVADRERNVIDKFNSAGEAQPFSATGGSSLDGSATPEGNFFFYGFTDLSVDNSGGATQGRIYVNHEYGPVQAFDATGSYLFRIGGEWWASYCGNTVDPSGHVWAGENYNGQATEFGNTGSPPEQIGAVSSTTGPPCRLAVDGAGNLYLNTNEGGVYKYAGGANVGTLDPNLTLDVTADQSSASGHVFTVHPDGFSEFDSGGSLVGTFGEEVLGSGVSIAYDAALDSVYVADEASKAVQVYGPAVTGTAPDTSLAAPSEAGLHTVHLSGTVNPQGVPNEYFFQWRQSGATSWTGAESSPHESLPADTTTHEVSWDATGLTSARTYEVRLVAVNTEGGFRTVAAGQSFTTLTPAAPAVTIEPASAVTSASAHLSGTVNPQEDPTTWSVELSSEPGCNGGFAQSGESHEIRSGETPVAVGEDIAGLLPNSHYCARFAATNNGGTTTSPAIEFTTSAVPPAVETVGSPFRTATTARLDARVNPVNSPTTYFFEYGPTSSYGSRVPASEEGDAGHGLGSVLASEQVEGLQPGATYHYRVVATNMAGTVRGEDRTVTTRSSDASLSHGNFPGPPNSDRAWELVSPADTGGSPVAGAIAISDDGNRAFYEVYGGTPTSLSGTLANDFFSERTPSGWQNRNIYPNRAEAPESIWFTPAGKSDLSETVSQVAGEGLAQEWRLKADGGHSKIYEIHPNEYGYFYEVSADASRVLALLYGSPDPQHPIASEGKPNLWEEPRQLYDITSGQAKLVSLMPDGTVPACGVPIEGEPARLPGNSPFRSIHWISSDGARAFFPSAGDECYGPIQLYMRNLNAGATVRISPPAISGPECSAALIKATTNAVFFFSHARLVAEDTAPASCGFDFEPGGDVYRYDLNTEKLSCVTCVAPNAEVYSGSSPYGASSAIGVAEDGSRVYFETYRQLVPYEGTEEEVWGQSYNVYRVDVQSGQLKYVATVNRADPIGDGGNVGSAISPDGSHIQFTSSSPWLNGLTASNNGGNKEYYLYNDNDRSLVCASCPGDGSPAGPVFPYGGVWGDEVGPNITPLAVNGDFAFATTTPLVAVDQNSAPSGQDPSTGMDVYEWRDGQVLLVTDGTTNWLPFGGPEVGGISPDGSNVFFTASAQLTPDALDSYNRLYDARIGGGFEYAKPPSPCPLEACQGIGAPPPNDPLPSSDKSSWRGNAKPGAQAQKPKGAKHRRKCRAGRRGHAKTRCGSHRHADRRRRSSKVHRGSTPGGKK